MTKVDDIGRQNDDADYKNYKNIFRAKSHDGEFTASVLPSKNVLSVLNSYFL